MVPVKRSLLLEETVSHLRQAISAGDFPRELPACRTLAKALQVSVPTLLAALEILVAEGLVSRGKPRQPYRLTASRAELPVGMDRTDRRCILLISAKPLGEFDSNTRATVDRLIVDSMRRSWEFQHRIVPYGEARRPSPRWDELLDEIRPTHLVALAGNLVLAEWAEKRGVPTLFIGGVPGETTVTAIGVSLKDRLEQALEMLLAQGHRYITLPICGLQEYFIHTLREVTATALASRGIPFVPTYHTPARVIRSQTGMKSLLPNVLAARAPTALIFVEWIDFVASIGLLAERGLVFGRDVTAVILTHDPQLEWFEPQPAYFRLPVRKLERILGEWLKNPRAPRFRKGGLMLLPCRFHEGGAFRGPVA